MNTVIEKKRIHSWDMARAIAMFLVVWGHALSGGGTVAQALYAFHVPALFLLSGLVFRPGGAGFGPFLGKKARRILVPYALFGLVSILIYALLGRLAADTLGVTDGAGDYSIGKNLLGLLYGNCKTGLMKWNLPLWFLPCLFVAELLQYAVEALCRRKRVLRWAFLPVSLAVSRWFGWDMLPFGLETALKIYPFFLLGALLREPVARWNSLAENKPGARWASAAVGALLLGLCLWVGLQNRKIIYTADVYGNLWLFYTAGVFGSLALLGLCTAVGRCRWLEYAGGRTMTVLCLHKFPLVFCQMLWPAVEAVGWAALLAAAACGACLAADWIIQRWFPFFLGEWYKPARRAK